MEGPFNAEDLLPLSEQKMDGHVQGETRIDWLAKERERERESESERVRARERERERASDSMQTNKRTE